MKKKLLALTALAALSMPLVMTNRAEAAPPCVMLRFEDDTRFDRVESAGTLSDLVMEKLLNSGRFNFKETKPINAEMEKKLYTERIAEFEDAEGAVEAENYSILFEGAGFQENRAQSIASARLGQIVSPEITSEIGDDNGAEYLIQGTILNLGTGGWINTDTMLIAKFATAAVSAWASQSAASHLGPLGLLARVVHQKTSMGVQADMRIIKASTGEVVWQKRITGVNSKTSITLDKIKIGSDKLTGEMYYKSMEDAAQKIADAVIADADSGALFAK